MLKKRIIIMISLIGLVVITLIAGSFAYLRATATQSTTNIISTLSCLEITVTNGENPFNLSAAYPINDVKGMEQVPYTFKLTNTCSEYVEVNIGFERLSNSTLEATNLKASLVPKDESGEGQILSSYPLGQAVNNGTAYVMYTDHLNSNEDKSYDFRMWLPYSLTEEDVHGKVLNGKIVVTATVTTPMPNGWANAEPTSLLGAIKKNYGQIDSATDVKTTPGVSTSYGSYSKVGNQDVSSTYQGYYWTYADDYELDPDTGKFNLKGIHIIKYSDDYSSLNGKYIVSRVIANDCSATEEAVSVTNLSEIYVVTNVTSSKLYYRLVGTWMGVDSTYQNYYWTYANSVEQINTASGNFNYTDIHTLKYSDDYGTLVGKYIVKTTASGNSNSSNTIKTPSSNNAIIYRVKYAGSNYLIYEMPSEARMAYAEDDYGYSYYFRGSVENNYVKFAGMCWRIVRIDGLGNIKLVLYNYNPNGASNPCAASEDDVSNAFARYDDTSNGLAGEIDFNYITLNVNGTNRTASAYNSGAGYMFGDSGSNNYDDEQSNINQSSVLTKLISWYDVKLRSYDSKLADVVWCNDKSLNTDSSFNPGNFSDATLNTGYNKIKSYYGSLTRLGPSSSWSASVISRPSFKCPDASGSDPNISRFTAGQTVDTNGNGELTINSKSYKIGLLTADEIVYAGAYGGSSNYGFYLFKNSNNDGWWTISPTHHNGSAIYIYSVGNSGNLSSNYDAHTTLGLRPAIALDPDEVTVTSGNGTQDSPFVVE